MKGLSEVTVSVFLILISVLLSVLIVSVFFGVFRHGQTQLFLEETRGLCVARVVAVANMSGRAALYVYNVGDVVCNFDAAYLYLDGVVANSSRFSQISVGPGEVKRVPTGLRYVSRGVYRLTGPRGELVEGAARP